MLISPTSLSSRLQRPSLVPLISYIPVYIVYYFPLPCTWFFFSFVIYSTANLNVYTIDYHAERYQLEDVRNGKGETEGNESGASNDRGAPHDHG